MDHVFHTYEGVSILKTTFLRKALPRLLVRFGLHAERPRATQSDPEENPWAFVMKNEPAKRGLSAPRCSRNLLTPILLSLAFPTMYCSMCKLTPFEFGSRPWRLPSSQVLLTLYFCPEALYIENHWRERWLPNSMFCAVL